MHHSIDAIDAASITVATSCITCWLWLPTLSDLSKEAALILPIGGVILLVLNAWLIMLKARHIKRGGEDL